MIPTDRPKYVLAVSGGVDSMVLLHMLNSGHHEVAVKLPANTEYIVAHVDHGIRPNSSRDEQHVRDATKKYGLQYESTTLELGADCSEDVARTARYNYLDSIVKKYSALGIVTAHHQDDIIETAIINSIRGSGRRGFVSLKSTPTRLRPLLYMAKADILEYAHANGVTWNEDETNTDPRYLRNSIRMLLGAKATPEWKTEYIGALGKIKSSSDQLDRELSGLISHKVRRPFVVSRSWITKLSWSMATEVVYAFLCSVGTPDIDRELVDRLTVAIKAGKIGTKVDIDKNTIGLLTKRSLRLVNRATLKTRTL
jgi:tRNA(Ile)-lysidine synthase